MKLTLTLLILFLLASCSPDIGNPTKPHNAKKVKKEQRRQMNYQFGR